MEIHHVQTLFGSWHVAVAVGEDEGTREGPGAVGSLVGSVPVGLGVYAVAPLGVNPVSAAEAHRRLVVESQVVVPAVPVDEAREIEQAGRGRLDVRRDIDFKRVGDQGLHVGRERRAHADPQRVAYARGVAHGGDDFVEFLAEEAVLIDAFANRYLGKVGEPVVVGEFDGEFGGVDGCLEVVVAKPDAAVAAPVDGHDQRLGSILAQHDVVVGSGEQNGVFGAHIDAVHVAFAGRERQCQK